MSNQESCLDQHSTRSAPSPTSPSGKSEVPSDLSSNRLTSSSRLPTPPQLQHHGHSVNTLNNITSFKQEQNSENFEPKNLKCSNLSPSNASGSLENKGLNIYSGANQFSSSSSDFSDQAAQKSLSNGYALNSPPYHHHHPYHPIHQQHPTVSPLSSPMPNEIGNQSQNSLRNDEPYHSHHHHHPSLYDSQLLLHHHANAHSHQSLHFNHEVPIGVNHGIGNNAGHHPYIQSPSPHPFHQGGNHPNIHQSHFEPEDYSPGKSYKFKPRIFQIIK